MSDKLKISKEISKRISPPFLILQTTTLFDEVIVAHGDMGIFIVVVIEDPASQATDDVWMGIGGDYNPREIINEKRKEFSEKFEAPIENIHGIVWIKTPMSKPKNIDEYRSTAENFDEFCSEIMEKIQKEIDENKKNPKDMTPWIGSYAAMAMTQKNMTPHETKIIMNLIHHAIESVTRKKVIECFGIELTSQDLADPKFMLPAIIVSAFDDWGLIITDKKKKIGFGIYLDPDPTALLGYRVSKIKLSNYFTFLTQMASIINRCERKTKFSIEEIIEQFSRFLQKHQLDATIIQDVDLRLLSSEE